MKKKIYFLFLLSFIFSCKNERTKIRKETLSYAQNRITQEIESIDDKWTIGEVTYWVRIKEDSLWTNIQPNDTLDNIEPEDTLKHARFWRRNKFNLVVNNCLSIEKNLLINPLTESKISETITYSKKINRNFETRISLTYDYNIDTCESFIKDSTSITKKKQNELKSDSTPKYDEKNGLYLCGTAAHETLRKGLPKLPVPYRIISLDSAFLIINKWKKPSL